MCSDFTIRYLYREDKVMPGQETAAAGLTISLADEHLTLLPQRAVWWEARRTLFIADLHLGKEATFRAAAIPIPDQTQECLSRLSDTVLQMKPERLIILGDLIHARRGRCMQTFQLVTRWREQFPDLKVDLVRGNHDQSSGDPPSNWGISCVTEPLNVAPLSLRHYPDPDPSHPVMAGHLHPTVRLTGPGRDSVRLPCFLLRESVLILPAFSSFVDGAAIRTQKSDQVFVICEGHVMKTA